MHAACKNSWAQAPSGWARAAGERKSESLKTLSVMSDDEDEDELAMETAWIRAAGGEACMPFYDTSGLATQWMKTSWCRVDGDVGVEAHGDVNDVRFNLIYDG
jgi:hypothetical protein